MQQRPFRSMWALSLATISEFVSLYCQVHISFGLIEVMIFHRVLLVVSSDLFYDYWLTVGDGFHVTKKNLHNFPVHDALLALLTTKLNTVQEIWKNRRHYAKKKVNSGVEIRSFDFSDAFPGFCVHGFKISGTTPA